jgi:hypothetical protein
MIKLRRAYEQYEKAALDWSSGIYSAEKKGEKRGEKRGEIKGERNNAIATARSMKADNMPVSQIINSPAAERRCANHGSLLFR